MPDYNTNGSSTRANKRPAKTAPDDPALCTFAEHVFGLWRGRVGGKLVAKKVAALKMRMTRGRELRKWPAL